MEARSDHSGIFDSNTKFQFLLRHLQLDNMTNQIMPVILAPTRPLLDKRDALGSAENSTLITISKHLIQGLQ